MSPTRLALPLLTALTTLGGFGCGEDPVPPNKPFVLSAEGVCRRVEGVYKLDQVTVEVADLDGVIDLDEPTATVVSTPLALMVEPRPDEIVDPESNEPLECEAPDGLCVARYTWRHSDTSEQIFCGEDGDLLEIIFEVDDMVGFWVRTAIPTRPL